MQEEQEAETVSYTHLDVYKRQGQACAATTNGACHSGYRFILAHDALVQLDFQVHEPVSYTHLDVYKRQTRSPTKTTWKKERPCSSWQE